MSTCQSTKTRPNFYSLCGCVLTKVTNSKCLGVTIIEDLQWRTHKTDTLAKASRMLGFLSRNLRGCPKELKQLAYFWLIRSILEYRCSIWDPYLIKDKDILNKVHGGGARFVCNEHQRDRSVTEMLESLMGFTTEQELQISDSSMESNHTCMRGCNCCILQVHKFGLVDWRITQHPMYIYTRIEFHYTFFDKPLV